jgi:uncharacterized protein YndB with AHSA1/START domain
MKTDIDARVTYPHPVDRVWAALTSSEALAAWFMPNDFKPVVGHRFTFRTRPARAMGFDGIVRCEVLEIAPPRRMVWSWAGGTRRRPGAAGRPLTTRTATAGCCSRTTRPSAASPGPHPRTAVPPPQRSSPADPGTPAPQW